MEVLKGCRLTFISFSINTSSKNIIFFENLYFLIDKTFSDSSIKSDQKSFITITNGNKGNL